MRDLSDSEIAADQLLETLLWHKAIIKKAEAERDAIIAEANDACEKRCAFSQEKISSITEKLAAFAEKNLPEERKTISLPHGTLSFRKQTPKFFFDDETEVKGSDERLITFCKANAPEYIKQKVIETADWSELKKQLIIAGNQVILRETGELIDGLTVQELPDKFTVTTA